MAASHDAEAQADRTPTLARLLDFYADGDPHDHFPWTFTRYAEPFQDRDGVVFGGISTPNGERPDGRMHTYWHVAGEIWEPIGLLICAAVNEAAHRRFGTPPA